MPGRVWADGCASKRVDGPKGHERTAKYIRFEQDPEAWTWWEPDGPILRV